MTLGWLILIGFILIVIGLIIMLGSEYKNQYGVVHITKPRTHDIGNTIYVIGATILLSIGIYLVFFKPR